MAIFYCRNGNTEYQKGQGKRYMNRNGKNMFDLTATEEDWKKKTEEEGVGHEKVDSLTKITHRTTL